MVAFELRELGSILTHIFVVPALVVCARRITRDYVPLALLVVMNFNSLLYHTCRLTEGQFCVTNLAIHQLMDHITAEGTVLLVTILFLRIPKRHQRDLVLLGTTYLLALLKCIIDTMLFTAVFVLLCFPWIIYVNASIAWRPWLILLITLNVAAGFTMYFLDQFYFYTHPPWHVFIWVALYLALELYYTTEQPAEQPTLERLEWIPLNGPPKSKKK